MRIQAILPIHPPQPRGGRPFRDDHQCLEGIYYLTVTGIQWGALPRCFGPKSTVHDRFELWVNAGVFRKLWKRGLVEYDQKVGIRWTWQAMDGAMTKAPLGGEATGPNPTDRAKKGVKRSLQTEGAGIPIGLAIGPANRNDHKLMRETLESRPLRPPRGTSQHMCLDKGYDYDEVREVLDANRFVAHIRSRGEEKIEMERNRKRRPRRWPVERTHSWMNRFRRLLVRWEKKLANYLAFAHLACAWITLRASSRE
ncbi:transposase [mine drainage metagenome]|uniref:Transposase n=1 Tax=mine drainage metagenome TaxID=410659 RepID=T1ACT8_9ZZZZ